MWLYYWLAAYGVHPFNDVKSIVVPPPQMVARHEIAGKLVVRPVTQHKLDFILRVEQHRTVHLAREADGVGQPQDGHLRAGQEVPARLRARPPRSARQCAPRTW